MPRWSLALILLIAASLSGLQLRGQEKAAPPADSKAGFDFFEKKIRPVLVEHCYQCHSADAQANKKLKGALLLDSKAGLLKGGDSGPSLVPGKAKKSLLIQALHYEDDVKMPPKRKLPDAVIADFEAWVNMGAPDPRAASKGPKTRVIDINEGRKFWAYQPLRKPIPPTPTLPHKGGGSQSATPALPKGGSQSVDDKQKGWATSDIDRFILAGLVAKGLTPVADADRATLIRRVYYDLIGLPPTPEEVDAFLNDRSENAYEKLVDRLLASPQFGERWGRHWLDVARFAESLTLRGFIMKEAWRYRDYVIEAFNQDMPFNRFVQEQVAGDLLPAATPAERRRQLIATTFLTLGNNNLEEQDKRQLRMDVVDEQLEAVGRAFLAQTIGCARCHDHKFDPIPTKDYYAMAGILRNAKTLEHANVSRWLEMPLPAEADQEAVLQKHEAAMADLQAKIKDLRGQAAAKVKPTPVGKPHVVAIKDLPGIIVDDTQAKKVGEWKSSQFSGSYVGDGYIHDIDGGKGEKTLTFQPDFPAAGDYEVRLAYSHGTNRCAKVPVTILSADGEKMVYVNQHEPPTIDGLWVSLGKYHFEKNNQGYVLISNEETKGHVIADAVQFIPVGAVTAKATPADTAKKPATADTAKKPPTADSDEVKKLEADLKKMQETGPKRPMVMTVVEEKEIGDTQVHIRGSVHNLGEKAPRGFLQVANLGSMPTLPANESGRRQLGEWLAGNHNPLTARVIANRTWHWLFGAGIVRTTDNFGVTGEMPSHPELLDYLAVRLVEENWSLKKLIRMIVLSRTYRLASSDPLTTQGKVSVDPENRLLAHMNRRRLDAECIRDTILFVSGQLQHDMGGPTYKPTLNADYGYKHTDVRRSVYAPVFRNSLPELFDAFDFADPSVATGRRNVSTVAPQALFMMNHPFVIEQARHAAQRLLDAKDLDDQGRIVRAYRLMLGRAPTADERRIALKFVSDTSKPAPESWALLCQALFASMDFRYVN